MTVHFHEEDLPAGVLAPGPIAVDTETMGLITPRDRLCVVQISDGKGDEHLVRFGVAARERLREEMQIEFVLTDGRISIIDAVRLQRSSRASVRIAVALPPTT